MPVLGTLASSVQKITGSFESIATITGNGSSNTLTFSSIPATYSSLQIRGVARTTRAANDSTLSLRFNSNNNPNYINHYINGYGYGLGASGSTSNTSVWMGEATGSTAASNLVGTNLIDIQDYASTTKNKTLRSISGLEVNGSGSAIYLHSGLFLSTSAINQIDLIVTDGSNWTSQTTFALYGIKGA
jgi:hypothetical protein